MAEGAVPTGDIQTDTTWPDIEVTATRPTARRDPLAQLGISPDVLTKYQDTQDARQIASDRADLAIKSNMAKRDEIMAQEIPRPEKPVLDELPAPPVQEKKDPLRVFGEFLPVLAVLGGAASRYSATAALDAATAAINAARAGDDAELKKADEQWNRQMDFTIKNNSRRLDQYRAVLDDRNLSVEDRAAQLSALAAANQDELLRVHLASGDLTAVSNMITTQANALRQIQDAYHQGRMAQIAQLKAEGSLGSASLGALKGADKDLLIRTQKMADTANQLRYWAGVFSRANENYGSYPGAGLNLFSPDVANMNQASSMMRGMMRVEGSGATSDYEQRLYKMGVPSVDESREANSAKVMAIEKMAQIAQAKRDFFEQYGLMKGTLGGADAAFYASPQYKALEDWSIIRNQGDDTQQMQNENRAPTSPDLPRVTNDAEFNALKSGDDFIDPQGNVRTKP